MARCLLVSALQVFPPQSGGHRRTAMLAEGLVLNGHEVRIHSLIGRKSDMLKGLGPTVQTGDQNIHEFIVRPKFIWLIAMICYKLKWPPFWASCGQTQKEFEEYLNWADCVVYDFPFAMPKVQPNLKLIVLNSHNVEHRLFYGNSWLKSMLSRWVLKKEQSAALSAHKMVVSSQEERLFFSQITDPSKIILVPNCVNEKRFSNLSALRHECRARLGLEDKQTVLFFAASAYGPNFEGYEFIAEFSEKNQEILTKLNLIFMVCGSVTKNAMRTPTLITTGPVDLIEPYFAAADWAMNPIFNGSGTSIKLAEMIAADLPILTTQVGARGFDLIDQKDALFFDRSSLLGILEKLPKDLKKTLTANAKTKNIGFLKPVKAVAPLAEAIDSSTNPKVTQRSF